jgi:putative membrane protein
MMAGGMLFGWILLIGIAVLVVWLFRSSAGRTDGPAGKVTPQSRPEARRSAMEVLEERFARGEIDKREFEERRDELREAHSHR